MNFGTKDLFLTAPDVSQKPVTETYGTSNMTQVIYTWLARYIESTNPSINAYTVSIDDGTETITSESISVFLNQKAVDGVKSIINDELKNVGYSGFAFPRLGVDIGRSISRVKGSFSFARGIPMPSILKRGYNYAKSALGSKTAKTVLKAAMYASPIGLGYLAYRNKAAIGKFVSRASSKTVGFVTTATKKLVSGPFSFLGGFVKKVLQVGSFLLRYWWLWLSMIVGALVLFATPVGPFILTNTFRKIVKR